MAAMIATKGVMARARALRRADGAWGGLPCDAPDRDALEMPLTFRSPLFTMKNLLFYFPKDGRLNASPSGDGGGDYCCLRGG
jgi:hypothetical protein